MFVCLRMDLAVEYPEHGMCCQFPSSGICHSSAPSSEKQDERLDFFGITCLGSCIMALLTSLGALALSHLCTAVSVGAWTAVHTSGVALVSVQHAGPFEKTGFSEVNLMMQFSGRPSCSLIRLDPNLTLPTSEGNDKHAVELAQGAESLLSCFRVCVRFLSPELLEIQ